MAWHRSDDKPVSELSPIVEGEVMKQWCPLYVFLYSYNDQYCSDAYMRHSASTSFMQYVGKFLV